MPNIIETWIPVLVVLLTILVMVILHILSKKKKKLICQLFPSLSLVDVRTEVKDKIKIYYNENLVENLSMTKVKIRNNGNLSIRREDIIKPLEFNFGENLRVIDSIVVNTEPKGITVNLESNNEKNRVKCSFDLLNRDDELILQFVCLGESKELPIISARIDGVKHVDVETISVSEENVERMRKRWKWYVYLGVIFIVIGVIVFVLTYDIGFASFFVGYGIATIILGFLTKVLPLWKYPKLQKVLVGKFEK